VHTSRTATNHLLAMAATAGIGRRRVDEVIDLVGLRQVADRRVGTFSLGMGQRLGIAAALLGDPATLLLDEPVNGLDPDGILWVRRLLKGLADEGRTVFLSSHLMSEMEMTADHLVVVGRGRLLRDLPIAEFIAAAGGGSVRVRSPQASELRDVLVGPDVAVSAAMPGELSVRGLTSEEIGTRAATAGLTLYELTSIRSSLEEAYMEITRDAGEFRAAGEPVAA
jgi:ABC-2 type transport system ATP-binding protein